MSRHADVTVVVPCFNHGAYLAEAVESALAQRGGAPNVIVVDDGSTEPETERALEALPQGVEAFRQANAGPAGARNAGIERSRTPLLLMLDADDRLPPDALDNLRAPLDADPKLGYGYGVMRMFGDLSGELRFPDYDPYRLLYRPIVGWIGMVRRRAWENAGGFDASLGGFEDWDFCLSALQRGWRGRRVPQVVLEYRKHSRSGLGEHRLRYRELYRTLRDKHAELYARSGEFARETDLGPLGRLGYRIYWGRRPIPARLELALYSRLFRGDSGS